MAQTDDFPEFADGDVQIVLSRTRIYQLDRLTLVRISPVLADLLPLENAAPLSNKAVKKGVTLRYRLDAEEHDEEENDCKLTLTPVLIDEKGNAISARRMPMVFEAARQIDPVYPAYDAVFRAFYGRPIEFGKLDTDATDILRRTVQVLLVAEYLQVVSAIAKQIEAALLALGPWLQHCITKHPPGWMDLAYRLKSAALFREAAIHAIGQFNTPLMQEEMNGMMRKSVLDLVKAKTEILREGVKAAILRASSYNPPTLTRTKTLGLAFGDEFAQRNYGKDTFGWFALTAFRAWITERLARDETHHAPDMGYDVIQKLGKGGDAYLDNPNMRQGFHSSYPVTDRGEVVVGEKLQDIKQHVATLVAPLLINNSQLDIAIYPREYFTCALVRYEDLPWVVEQATAEAAAMEEDEDEDE